jgi:hypothetical protein
MSDYVYDWSMPADLAAYRFDLDIDLDQWIDPDLPRPAVDWMDLVDWFAGGPDALGSFDAGPIR